MLPVKWMPTSRGRFEHAVLLVTLPKSEAAKPRRISVNDLVSSPAIKNEQQTELDKPEGTLGLCFTPRVDIMETEEESLLLADLSSGEASVHRLG
jgi:HSP20 family molecular chaperone IbpA